VKIEVKLTGLDGVLDTLRSLPPELVSKRGGPVRRALAKGARLIADEAKANVRAIVAEPNKDGRPTKSTGALEKAIRVSRKKLTSIKGERYLVWLGKSSGKFANTKRNVRSMKAGLEYEKEPPQFYGRFLEYGTSRMRPHPWIRPAFQKKAAEAISVIESELVVGVERIVKKLAAKNRIR